MLSLKKIQITNLKPWRKSYSKHGSESKIVVFESYLVLGVKKKVVQTRLIFYIQIMMKGLESQSQNLWRKSNLNHKNKSKIVGFEPCPVLISHHKTCNSVNEKKSKAFIHQMVPLLKNFKMFSIRVKISEKLRNCTTS